MYCLIKITVKNSNIMKYYNLKYLNIFYFKRRPIMLFHFLNFSQCVECMFGHKTIYKVTNLKVHSKGRYLVFKKSLFKNYNEGSFGLQSCFPVFVTSQILNPTYGNLNGWRVGRTLGWALHVSKSKPSMGVFISLYFWWKPTEVQQKI